MVGIVECYYWTPDDEPMQAQEQQAPGPCHTDLAARHDAATV